MTSGVDDLRPPRHWGASAADLDDSWPADPLASEAAEIWIRALDVRAPPEVVFRWLCQLRVAPYSYDWIDNFGRRSPREVTPGLDALAKGQRVMGVFTIVDFAPGEFITIGYEGFGSRLFGRLLVTYRVTACHPEGSRLAVKLYVPSGRNPLRWLFNRALAWGDLIMMRKQLLTLKALAEGEGRPAHWMEEPPEACR